MIHPGLRLILAFLVANALPLCAQEALWPPWIPSLIQSSEAEQEAFADRYAIELDQVLFEIRRAYLRESFADASESRPALKDAALRLLRRGFAREREAPYVAEIKSAFTDLTAETRPLAESFLSLADAMSRFLQSDGNEGRTELEAAHAKARSLEAKEPGLERLVARVALLLADPTDRLPALGGYLFHLDRAGLDTRDHGLTTRLARVLHAINRSDFQLARADLDHLREIGITSPSMPILHRMRFAATALECGRLTGEGPELYALADLMDRELIPAFAQMLKDYGAAEDPGALAELAAYETTAARWLASFGAHERALGLVERARERVDPLSPEAPNLALFAASFAEANHELDLVFDLASRSLSLLREQEESIAPRREPIHALLRWKAELALWRVALQRADLALALEARSGAEEAMRTALSLEVDEPLSTERKKLHLSQTTLVAMDADANDQLALALASLQEAAAIAKDLPPSAERVQLAWLECRIRLRMGASDEALAVAQEAVRLADEAVEDAAWLRGHADVILAELYLRRGQPRSARVILLAALERLPGEIDAARPALAAEMRRLLAQSFEGSDARRLETAREAFEQTFERFRKDIAEGPVDPAFLIEVLQTKLDLCALVQNLAGGSQSEEAIEALLRDARGVIQAQESFAGGANNLSAHNTAKGMLEVLEARVARARGADRLAQAAYRRALKALAPYARRVRSGPATDVRTLDFEQEALGFALDYAARHPSDATLADAARNLREELFAREFERVRRARLAEASNAAVPTIPSPRGRLDLPESRRRLLQNGDAHLAYVVIGEDAYGIWITAERTVVKTLPLATSRIEALARSLRWTLSSPPDAHRWTSFTASGLALYEGLLKPFARELETTEHLVILPDGPIHAVPFAALPTRDLGGPLGEGLLFFVSQGSLNSLAYAPSAAFLAEDFRARAEPEGRAILIGAPEGLAPRFEALPHVAEELETIGGFFRAAARQVLVGEKARWNELCTAVQGGGTILHIATHGESERAAEGLPALFFAPEKAGDSPRAITPKEVQAEDFSALRLVVLAACQSGGARPVPAEGALGLPRAFLIAGARAVLAAHPSIDDRLTARWMQAFYRALKASDFQRPGSAVLKAQREAIADPQLRWPGYWGGFYLLGRAGR